LPLVLVITIESVHLLAGAGGVQNVQEWFKSMF
jgi:hypothetical protein